MELIKLEQFIEEYWKNPEYEELTFAFGEEVVITKGMLNDAHIHLRFAKSSYFPKVWGEIRDDYTNFIVGIQFRFNEVKILDMGKTVFHIKIDLPEEEYL